MTTLAHQITRQCEGSMYPAIHIKHTLLHTVSYITVNVVPKELVERLEEAGDTKDDKCVVVVQSEGRVVNQAFLDFESGGKFP